MKRVMRAVLFFAAVLACGAPAPVAAQQTEYRGAAALGLALRKLGTTKRVLMIGAHPDDEDTQLLSRLVLAEGAEAAYLSLTRGEGGQNSVGAEFGEALGLVRTGELLAARRLDGAAQFFTRAYDFGYSKSADETFRHWPRDSILADVVAVVRAYRPDIIISIFSGTPRDGHGQHQVAGILAREAYEAAGDPARFPDQLAGGLRPFTPQKLYRSSWFRPEDATLRVPTGELDPLLGRSHFQVAMASRSRHRSQDMGQLELPGPRSTFLVRVASRADAPAEPTVETSLFTGIDTTLAVHAVRALRTVAATSPGKASSDVTELLQSYDRDIARLRARLDAFQPAALVPGLAAALGLLEHADSLLEPVGGTPVLELRARVRDEAGDVRHALRLAAGLELDVVADGERVVPGQPFQLSVSLWNGGATPVTVRELAPALPAGWIATPLDTLPAGPLPPGSLWTRQFRVQAPTDAQTSEPYFLRSARSGDMYVWPAARSLRTRPFEPAIVRGAATVVIDATLIALQRRAEQRQRHPVQGEVRRPVMVVPAVSVELDPANAILPLRGRRDEPVQVRATVRAHAPVNGRLRLVAPPGWRAEPSEVPLALTRAGAEHRSAIRLHAPSGATAGTYALRAVFEADNGTQHARGYRLIDHPHIEPRPLYRPASVEIRAFDVRLPRTLKIGYIMGAGDDVPAALAQLGLAVELLDSAALSSRALERYDAVVVGIRAYEARADLAAANTRLLHYAVAGGTVIVQYQQYEYPQGGFAPFPLTIARPHDRITDETAAVRFLEPLHPVLTMPNVLSPADFEGWVQERGLYFARSWDERYVPVLETSDAGEEPLRGGLLIARYDRGTYVYTGLAFFRQLPAGVPGAYRLFANLLSLSNQ